MTLVAYARPKIFAEGNGCRDVHRLFRDVEIKSCHAGRCAVHDGERVHFFDGGQRVTEAGEFDPFYLESDLALWRGPGAFEIRGEVGLVESQAGGGGDLFPKDGMRI